MAERQMNAKPFFVIGLIVVIAGGGWFILGGGEKAQYYDFASCLAENDVTMYGYDLCPNCNKQKDLIGRDAFNQYIAGTGRYVKCRPTSEATEAIGDRLQNITVLEQYEGQYSASTTQGDLCADNVGRGTPTWTFPQDDRTVEQVSGWRSIPELAQLSGCPVPEGAGGQTQESDGKRFTE